LGFERRLGLDTSMFLFQVNLLETELFF